MICNECETVAHCAKHGCIPKQPAPVQEPVAILNHAHGVYAFRSVNLQGLPDGEYQVYTTPPAAQPAVPDAFGTREGEHPEYIQGWNDCRAEMLRGMKP